MDHVNGNTAEEVAAQYPDKPEGVPTEHREKFSRQMAQIMIKLASIRMPAIGSIIRDPADPSLFDVGPLTETGSGPYESAAELYADYPLALHRKLANGGEPVEWQRELVESFRSLAASFPHPATGTVDANLAGGFGLANFDLNPNNVLVDHDYNVLAVIDWDAVAAVPDAALYRIPALMGLSCAVPGIVDEDAAEKARQLRAREFAAVVEAMGREMKSKGGEGVNERQICLRTKSGFPSKQAVAFRSLTFVKMEQDFVNRSWIKGLEWLSEHDEAAVARFYF
ncbi:hypothetical protein F5B17DRAFT_423019 [Nemania serpens]|nr:hypothetical protein F5B17DRAFT_423019 [Nemania serpens]